MAGDHAKPETLAERALRFKFALKQLDLYHCHGVYKLGPRVVLSLLLCLNLKAELFWGKTELASRLLN